MSRIHQNPTALLETGSFRPSVYSAGLAGLGNAVVFKTSAIDHSATPPRNQINGLADLGNDHIPVVCVQRNRAPGLVPPQAHSPQDDTLKGIDP